MTHDKVYFQPISLKHANAFYVNHHRHSNKLPGHLFSICCKNMKNELLGVVSASRPVSRYLDDGLTIEVRRLCVLKNKKNLCSVLYSKINKIAKIMGYTKIITYTLNEEIGLSLIASNFVFDGETSSLSQNWNYSRKKPQQKIIQQKQLDGNKKRWIKNIETEYKTIRIDTNE